MATQFTLPRQVKINVAGRPYAGAKAFFYQTGTEALQSVYQDVELTTTHPQPVSADDDGYFPIIWLNPSADFDYRCVILSSANVQLDDVPIPRKPFTSVDIGTTLDSLKRTDAERAAGVTPVNYAFEPYDIRRYWSSSGDIDQAMANALAVCGSAGGRIKIPAGEYTSSSQWNLNQKQGVLIEGDGASTAGANNATIITYTGTGSSPWILMTSAFGCQIRNMTLKHSSSSFTGAMVRIGNDGTHGDSFECSLIDVLMDAGSNTAYHLDLDRAIVTEFIRCHFYGGAVSVKGQAAAGGSYSNAIRFQTCQWVNAAATPVNYGGQAWTFDSCNFQQLADGKAGAFQALGTTECVGLSFRSCWFGDVTEDGGIWISVYGPAFSATGNYFSGTSGSVAITLYSVAGAHITGNGFYGFGIALSLSSESKTKGLIYNGNSFNGVDTQLSGGALTSDGPSSIINPNLPMIGASGGLAPFFASGVQGWEYSPNGHLEIWGLKGITAGTGATITYATEVSGFPGFTEVYSVLLTGVAPGASVTNVYSATPSTTAVNVNANGTGTVGVYWRIKGK